MAENSEGAWVVVIDPLTAGKLKAVNVTPETLGATLSAMSDLLAAPQSNQMFWLARVDSEDVGKLKYLGFQNEMHFSLWVRTLIDLMAEGKMMGYEINDIGWQKKVR